VVPEPICPDAGEDGERHDQHTDDHQCRQDGASPTADPQATQPTSPRSSIFSWHISNEPKRRCGSAADHGRRSRGRSATVPTQAYARPGDQQHSSPLRLVLAALAPF
jgi:hypothetical protein